MGKRGSPTEESHLHLPDAGQVWPHPRPHGGGVRRATLRDHAVFCPYPAQGNDRGGGRYAGVVANLHFEFMKRGFGILGFYCIGCILFNIIF